MIPSVQRRLETFRQQARVNAGSVIMSVFGDAILPRGGSIWLGSLIRLLEPLSLNERLVRTSVFRLAQEHWLRTETVGRRANYVLTPSGQRRFEEASRQIYATRAPLWDRRWRLILVVGEMDGKSREKVRRALFWQGFGMLGADCFLHPSADLTAAFDTLVAEGMADTLSGLMPMLSSEFQFGLSARDTDLVRRAWNLDGLAQAYGGFVDSYLPVLADLRRKRLPDIADQDAFLLRTLLIHDYRRLLLRDPELPDVLLPLDWPGHRARLLCKELYRCLLEPSERHLDQHLLLADGTPPPVTVVLAERFQDPPASLPDPV